MLKVLIVDDDINVIDLMTGLMDWKEIGCELVGCAKNGAAALEIIEKDTPECVITDIKMPVMDGIELSKRLRAQYPNIDIIFLSAYEDFNAAKTGMNFGINEYILKPIDADKLEYLKEKIIKIRDERTMKKSLNDFIQADDVDLIPVILDENGTSVYKDMCDYCLKSDNKYILCVISSKAIDVLYAYLKIIGINDDIIKQNMKSNKKKVFSFESPIETVDFVNNLIVNIKKIKAYGEKEEILTDIVEKIQEYVNDNFKSYDFSVSLIADHFKLSVDHISRVFKKQAGMNLSTYIKMVRMEYAKKLLLETEKQVGEIADECGYSTTSYFLRVFHSYYNLTPTEVRSRTSTAKRYLEVEEVD